VRSLSRIESLYKIYLIYKYLYFKKNYKYFFCFYPHQFLQIYICLKFIRTNYKYLHSKNYTISFYFFLYTFIFIFHNYLFVTLLLLLLLLLLLMIFQLLFTIYLIIKIANLSKKSFVSMEFFSNNLKKLLRKWVINEKLNGFNINL
jgi:hypothetical protein